MYFTLYPVFSFILSCLLRKAYPVIASVDHHGILLDEFLEWSLNERMHLNLGLRGLVTIMESFFMALWYKMVSLNQLQEQMMSAVVAEVTLPQTNVSVMPSSSPLKGLTNQIQI